MKEEYAFPTYDTEYDPEERTFSVSTGMTLRDYFAACALTGMCSMNFYEAGEAANEAYAYADAMLKARKEQK